MIIGLVGQARSGKSTVAEHWAATQGFTIVSFAEQLKRMVLEGLLESPPPFDEYAQSDMGHPTREDWIDALWVNRTPFTRWLLQFVGTQIVRKIDTDYWVDTAMNQIMENALENVVIPDVRFINEANAIKAAGGVIVRVMRESGAFVEFGADHASEREQAQIDADYTISAPNGVERLKAIADQTLRLIRQDDGERVAVCSYVPRRDETEV